MAARTAAAGHLAGEAECPPFDWRGTRGSREAETRAGPAKPPRENRTGRCADITAPWKNDAEPTTRRTRPPVPEQPSRRGRRKGAARPRRHDTRRRRGPARDRRGGGRGRARRGPQRRQGEGGGMWFVAMTERTSAAVTFAGRIAEFNARRKVAEASIAQGLRSQTVFWPVVALRPPSPRRFRPASTTESAPTARGRKFR